jgi:hypothetical protein
LAGNPEAYEKFNLKLKMKLSEKKHTQARKTLERLGKYD